MSERSFWTAAPARVCSTEAEHGCGDCACCGEEYNANRRIIMICLPTGALVDEHCGCAEWRHESKRYRR